MGQIWSLEVFFLPESSMNLTVKWFIVLLQIFCSRNSVKEKEKKKDVIVYVTL